VPHLTTLTALRALYAPARERSVQKEMQHLDPHALRFIGLSPWVVVASASHQTALDASPRGGAPGFVKTPDAHTLLIPDSPGNNRLDTLENIVQTGQVGLLFVVPGMDETLRVNGPAVLSVDAADIALCADDKRQPKVVIRVTVAACYLHCAKAMMRSALWDASRHVDRDALPTMGEMLRDQIGGHTPLESQADMLARYAQDL